MMRNLLLTISYDGKNFSGFQKQKDLRTVQSVLEEALSKFTGIDVTINGASRTDSGVHAYGQTASFKGDFSIPTDNLVFALNNYFAGGKNSMFSVGDIKIVSAKEMPLDFHARFDSKGKTYEYVLLNSKDLNPFRKDYSYQITTPLDIDRMNEACKYIIGTHDFKCFESAGSIPRETTIRTIYNLNVKKKDDDVIITVTGDGFLYNMVRIITGTLVEVGLHKKEPKDLIYILESKDRGNAGFTAPASGLYLKEVYYEEMKNG